MEDQGINYNFNNQVALITGVGSGIGEAVNSAFANMKQAGLPVRLLQ